MVKLNKIYTKTGDKGKTSLATGQKVSKTHIRIKAFGTIDELNSFLGLAVNKTQDETTKNILLRIQNDLFDLGADLATPQKKNLRYEALRIVESQYKRLENEIDEINQNIPPLDSFVLPGGSESAALLHICRTIARRAEREIASAIEIGEEISKEAFIYTNRLSDLFFVLARRANEYGAKDIKWIPAKNR